MFSFEGKNVTVGSIYNPKAHKGDWCLPHLDIQEHWVLDKSPDFCMHYRAGDWDPDKRKKQLEEYAAIDKETFKDKTILLVSNEIKSMKNRKEILEICEVGKCNKNYASASHIQIIKIQNMTKKLIKIIFRS